MNKSKKKEKQAESVFWAKAGVIITGLGVLVTIIYYFTPYIKDLCNRPTERELLKTEINGYINTINASFHPDKISLENDSLGELAHIKNFQVIALKLTTMIQSSYQSNRSLDNYTEDLQQYSQLIHTYSKQRTQSWKYIDELFKECDLIWEIMKRQSINDSYAQNAALRLDVEETLIKMEIEQKEADKKISEYIDKNKLKKAIEVYNKDANSLTTLKLDALSLKYLIDCNRVFEGRINDYSLQ